MFKLSRYGIREWLGSALIAFIVSFVLLIFAIVFKLWWIYLIVGCVVFIWLSIAAFFRDPEREIPEGEEIFVSPADGHITEIKTINDSEYSDFFDGKPVTVIGIFLSVLDVHINRAPFPMIVEDLIYKEGKFFDARDKRASKENESNTILCYANTDKYNFPMVIVQISGAIARRIVCPIKPKDKFSLGEKFGMIKFGSRTELHIPSDLSIELLVKEGDKVFAGSSIIGKLEVKSENAEVKR